MVLLVPAAKVLWIGTKVLQVRKEVNSVYLYGVTEEGHRQFQNDKLETVNGCP